MYRIEAMDRTLQSAAGATGTGTNLELNARYGTAALQVTGTFTATITFQASNDGTNWADIQATSVSSGTAATTATAAGIYRINVTGIKLLRANITAFTSGTITVKATAVNV